ncbi:MAG: low molecular weight protein arginine phosphatase [Deltaproteobacteria bacterium]|nr:low molecular weight protein arginine phosphatase [Deltaproteobacteria bacterium]
MKKQIANILFVCWGNICRSPFAGALFTKLSAQNSRKDLSGDSAGLFALHGNSATHMAQKVAAEYGVDLTRHAAKPVSRPLVDRSDLIIVMTKSHRDTLSEVYPEAAEKTRLMKHFARFGSKNRGIADPYGLNYEAYRFCFLDIEDAVIGLIDFLSDGLLNK